MVGGRGNSVIPLRSRNEPRHTRPNPVHHHTSLRQNDEHHRRAYQNSNPKIGIKTQVLDTVEPFEAKKATPIVNVLASSVRKVINKPATLLRKTGTGDMNILGNAMNLPIVTYGPGDGHLDHTPDEHIEVAEYLQAIDVYKDFLLKLSDIYNNKNGAGQATEQ